MNMRGGGRNGQGKREVKKGNNENSKKILASGCYFIMIHNMQYGIQWCVYTGSCMCAHVQAGGCTSVHVCVWV